MLTGKSIYDASLAAAGYLHDRPMGIMDLCCSSTCIYTALCSLLYEPSVMSQVNESVSASRCYNSHRNLFLAL